MVYESPGGEITLEVLDLRGRRVRTLLRGPVEAGVHELVFDGRDDRGRELASGTYLLRVVGERGEDSLRVTCYLMHAAGHEESAVVTIPGITGMTTRGQYRFRLPSGENRSPKSKLFVA